MDQRRRSPREPAVRMWNARPTPRNFLTASKAKALQGVKILLNMSLRDKLVLLVACMMILGLSYIYIEAKATYSVTNSVRTHPTTNTIDTAVLYLQRPQRPFHGNHWFHIGEYYISRQENIHRLLAKFDTKYPIRHLKLVVHDYRLTKTMTKMSFALIVLSCLGQLTYEQRSHIMSIELYAPKAAQYFKHSDYINDISKVRNGSVLTMIENAPPLFGYYNADSNGVYIDRVALLNGGSSFGKVVYEPPNRIHSAANWLSSWKLINPTDISHLCTKNPCRDAVYVGSIGDVPIAPVDWFQSSQQADYFRQQAVSMCGINMHNAVEFDTVQRTYTMVVYQRDLNRRFIHLNKVVETLKSHTMEGVKWNIEVLRHRENMDPCALIKAFYSADILLTAHGFQSTGMYVNLLMYIFPSVE